MLELFVDTVLAVQIEAKGCRRGMQCTLHDEASIESTMNKFARFIYSVGSTDQPTKEFPVWRSRSQPIDDSFLYDLDLAESSAR